MSENRDSENSSDVLYKGGYRQKSHNSSNLYVDHIILNGKEKNQGNEDAIASCAKRL